MGAYAVAMIGIAGVLGWTGERQSQDLIMKFLEHFAGIRQALDQQGLWDDADGLFYDRLVLPSGAAVPVKVRSMVGMIPALAAAVIDGQTLQNVMSMNKMFMRFLRREGVGDMQRLSERPQLRGEPGHERLLLSVAKPNQIERLFAKLFDESEFLSPHGLRALSAYHRDHPYYFDVGDYRASIDYEPAESTTSMFGGNSNWRGPIWMPVNYLLVEVLERYHRFYGKDLEVEYPTGSGKTLTLDLIAADLQDRLISLFTNDADGRRACFGGTERMQTDPAWHDNLIFSEYFHGDNGAAIGAFHQTGWTGLIADLILRRHGAVRALGDVLRDLPRKAQQKPAAVTSNQGPAAAARVAPMPRRHAPRQAVPAGGHARRAGRRRRDELRDRLVRRRQRHLVPVRRDRRGNPDPGAGQRRRRLARVRARRRPGAGLRVPGQRPVGPGARPAVQPGQAAARPVRQGDQRVGHLRAGGARPGRDRPGQTERAGLLGARAAEPGRGLGSSAGRTTSRTRHRTSDTILYEIHVKGFTMRHPDIPPELRGTYAGLAHEAAIAHLTGLGVTTVELLPVHQNVPEAFLVGGGLTNYWGYNTIGYFAPHNGYSAAVRAGQPGGQVDEFKAMVDALHRAGLEVVLDVVFNHTAEAGPDGPRCASAASTTPRTTGPSPVTRLSISTRPAAATR